MTEAQENTETAYLLSMRLPGGTVYLLPNFSVRFIGKFSRLEIDFVSNTVESYVEFHEMFESPQGKADDK